MKNKFVKQLTQIERREARLRRIRIRAKLSKTGQGSGDLVARTPEEHYHIGVSEKSHLHIGTFLSKNAGDPAIQVWIMQESCSVVPLTPFFLQDFLPKLKQHLLPRVVSMLQGYGDTVGIPSNGDPNAVIFQLDRIYKHQLMRINHTTYDVRRSQDIVNPSTAHCNIMVFSGDDSTSHHPFKYARVLGIFHANVVYLGPGMLDYRPHRLDFLWVRWYRTLEMRCTGWAAQKLDRIKFCAMAADDTFAFLDPSDVVRSCHIIPAFARGKHYADGKGLSFLAHDSTDWTEYYINR